MRDGIISYEPKAYEVTGVDVGARYCRCYTYGARMCEIVDDKFQMRGWGSISSGSISLDGG